MKGVIFREFLDFLEQAHGYELVDKIITKSQVPSEGAYTSVATYPHDEMISLVVALSEETGASVPDLCKLFGKELFGRLDRVHQGVVASFSHVFDFLEALDNEIHRQVRKLYDNAEVPDVFVKEREGEDRLVVHYLSSRPFADVAYGLLEGAIAHFGTPYEVEKDPVKEDGTEAYFTLQKAA